MQLSVQQVKQILKNKPLGTSNEQVLDGLIKRGYNLEGMDPVQTAAYRSQVNLPQETSGNVFEEKKSFWQKARDFTADLFGGRVLAEATGKALAAPQVQATLDDAASQLYETQGKLIQRIKQKKLAGEDTSRLEAALQIQNDEIARLQDVSGDFIESLPTSKQVIGSATRLAASAALPTVAGKATKAFGVGKATTVGSGMLRGAGAGVTTGALEGAVQGAGIAAEQDMSTEDIIKSGAWGAASGALIGGAIGTIGGGVSGAKKQVAIKRQDALEEMVAPKEVKKVRIQAIKEGRVKDPGLLKKAELQYSKNDKEVINAVKDVIDPKNTIGGNVTAMNDEIATLNNGVESYIREHKVPVNKNQIRKQLESGKDKLKIVFASDANAEKTYNAIVDAFVNQVEGGDTLGVFKARQNFDKIPGVKQLLDSSTAGEQLKKQIVMAVRGSANDYIDDLLPVKSLYKGVMKKEHLIYQARDNFAENAERIIGKNKLQMLTQDYPLVKLLVGSAAAGVGGIIGAKLAGGVGAGGSIIGSTD